MRSCSARPNAHQFNLAWQYLTTRGRLSNTELLNHLRVHRSSAVCAILTRLPGVEVARGAGLVLRYRGAVKRGLGRAPHDPRFSKIVSDPASVLPVDGEPSWVARLSPSGRAFARLLLIEAETTG